MSKITLSFMQRFMGELDTAIRNFVGGITGDLDELETTDKSSLVNAINEVKTGSSVVTSLAGLDDVTLTTPTNGQILKYNSTSHKWENANESGGGGGGSSTLSGLTDVDFTSLADGQLIQYDATTEKWKNIGIDATPTQNSAKPISSGGAYSALGDKADKPTLKTQTLSAGSTSVTFTGIPTTGNVMLDIYTSKAGLDYTSLDDSTAGTLVVTYEAQSSAVTVYLKIEVLS